MVAVMQIRMSVSVIHHTLLELRGGASRVASILNDELAAMGVESSHSFEVAESRDGEAALLSRPWPARLEEAIAAGSVVHVHSTSQWHELLAFLAARQARTVITLHDFQLVAGGCVAPVECDISAGRCPDPCPRGYPDPEGERKLRKRLVGNLDPVIASPSEWLRRQAASSLEREVVLVPNGVPWPQTMPDAAAKSAAKKALGIAQAARTVLFVAHGGRRAAYKAGHEWDFIWRLIKEQVPGAVGIMAGGKSMERDGDLLRLPYLEPEHLARVLTAADVLCYPTLADNHPLAVLEAMAHGAAVAASAVGGVKEQVADGVNGLLAPPEEWETLATHTAELLARPPRCRELSRTAFEQGAKRFNARRMAEDYRTLYGRVLG